MNKNKEEMHKMLAEVNNRILESLGGEESHHYNRSRTPKYLGWFIEESEMDQEDYFAPTKTPQQWTHCFISMNDYIDTFSARYAHIDSYRLPDVTVTLYRKLSDSQYEIFAEAMDAVPPSLMDKFKAFFGF